MEKIKKKNDELQENNQIDQETMMALQEELEKSRETIMELELEK